MKLSKRQKDIIQNIMNGKITDIYSFVKYYKLGREVSFDKREVEDKFNKAYKDKKFICKSREFYELNSDDRIRERIDDKTAYCVPKLSFEGVWSQYSNHNIRYAYHLFKPVYIIEDISEIISFIALWQYLNSLALIIELPKSCTKEDMELFLEQERGEEREYISLEDTNDNVYDYYNLDISFYDFFDGKYNLNEENFEICLPYLERKIYPAPELKTFIQKGYNTNEELNNRRNMWIAFAGVIIAILTSFASIWISYNGADYKLELQNANNYLQDISDSLNKVESVTINSETKNIETTNKTLQQHQNTK